MWYMNIATTKKFLSGFGTLCAVCVVCIQAELSFAEETLRIGIGGNHPPYVFESTDSGIEIDILEKAFRTLGFTIEWVYLNNVNRHLGIKRYNLDVAATIRDRYRLDTAFYSSPYISYQNVAISRLDNHLVIENIRDLKKYRVGSWELASGDLGDEFAMVADHLGIRYKEYSWQSNQVQEFCEGKVDVIVIDINIYRWFSKKMCDSKKMPIKVHDVFPGRTSFIASFKNEQLRDDFNRELIALKATGEHQENIDHYLGVD